MEGICFSETSFDFHWITWWNNPENNLFNIYLGVRGVFTLNCSFYMYFTFTEWWNFKFHQITTLIIRSEVWTTVLVFWVFCWTSSALSGISLIAFYIPVKMGLTGGLLPYIRLGNSPYYVNPYEDFIRTGYSLGWHSVSFNSVSFFTKMPVSDMLKLVSWQFYEDNVWLFITAS
jgi:hypothetical protein